MSLGERSGTAVDSLVGDLYEDYEGFDVFSETVTLGDERYDRERSLVAEGLVAGVSVWIESPDRGLLMVEPAEDRGTWSVPSVDVGTDRPFERAAADRVRECTSLECAITGVDSVRRTRIDPADGDGPTLHRLWVYADAEIRGSGEPDPGAGVADVAWRTSARNVPDATVAGRLAARSDGGNRILR